jgi:hypothetical protein
LNGCFVKLELVVKPAEVKRSTHDRHAAVVIKEILVAIHERGHTVSLGVVLPIRHVLPPVVEVSGVACICIYAKGEQELGKYESVKPLQMRMSRRRVGLREKVCVCGFDQAPLRKVAGLVDVHNALVRLYESPSFMVCTDCVQLACAWCPYQ